MISGRQLRLPIDTVQQDAGIKHYNKVFVKINRKVFFCVLLKRGTAESYLFIQ
jgi:hypothetical protein